MPFPYLTLSKTSTPESSSTFCFGLCFQGRPVSPTDKQTGGHTHTHPLFELTRTNTRNNQQTLTQTSMTDEHCMYRKLEKRLQVREVDQTSYPGNSTEASLHQTNSSALGAPAYKFFVKTCWVNCWVNFQHVQMAADKCVAKSIFSQTVHLLQTHIPVHPNARPNQFIKRSLMYRRSMKLRRGLGGGIWTQGSSVVQLLVCSFTRQQLKHRKSLF